MFKIPAYNSLRHHVEYNRELYKAMNNNDMSEVVMVAYDILKNRANLFYKVKDPLKSELQSDLHRKRGNKCFDLAKYNEAFVMYNMALSFAPKGSRALKLAYSNKSALFHKIQRYQECIIEIDKCFSLDCPEDLVSKLTKRKEDATRLLKDIHDNTWIDDDYLNLKSLINETPYVSKYMKITNEPNATKVVATTDIKLGTVVAIEKAFVCNTLEAHKGCCYYCQKFALNLIPCYGCCNVLFCNEKCQESCMTEYHKIECGIIDFLSILNTEENLMFKYVIRLLSTGTWEELIEISNRIKAYKGQFDVYSKFSVFNLRDNKPFKFGKMYNASFSCATLIRYLEGIPSIFPESPMERLHSIQALGRMMMLIVLNCKGHLIVQAAKNVIYGNTTFNSCEGFGFYPLIENFKKSCEHNVTAAFVKNKMVLVARKPIKSGTEITIPYVLVDFKLEFSREKRNILSFMDTADVCKSCANDTHTPQNTHTPFWLQREICDTFSLLAQNPQLLVTKLAFSKLCHALTKLSNNDEAYDKTIYNMFIDSINLYLLQISNNMLLH